jgi:tetratricopeptide (TPR) repeat protein
MTIVCSNTPTRSAPASDPLGNAVKASERALQNDNVPAALKVLSDYIDRADRVCEAQQDKLEAQLSRVAKKARVNNLWLAGCYVARGKLYQKAGDLGGANQQFETAGKLNPRNACIPFYLGVNHETIVRTEQATAYFDRAIEIEQKIPGKNNRHCADQAAKHLIDIAAFLSEKIRIINEAAKVVPPPDDGER